MEKEWGVDKQIEKGSRKRRKENESVRGNVGAGHFWQKT